MTGSLLKKKDYLGPLSFYRVALSLALPVMAQNLIQSMVSLIDNFMVAGLGDVKMSGVNIAGQINFVFYVLLTTLCASGGIFMSQYNGAKDAAGMRQAFRFKIIITLAASIAYTIFCLANPKPVLALMVRGNRQSAEIVVQACIYMKTAAFTWIPIAIAVSIGSSMREIGRVRQPLVVSAVATFINTFFNWIFIYGNLGAPRLEVKGAAIATIIARASEALIFLIYIRKTKPPFFSYLRELFRVRFGFFVNVLSKSGMILVSEMSWVLTESVVTALYNSRGGAEIVSGMSAGFTVANLFFICFYGINASIGVIMGGTLGSNQLEKAKVQKTWLLNGAFLFGLSMGILGCFTTFLIPFVFLHLSEAARHVTRNMVFLNACYMPIWAYLNAQFTVSRTGGDVLMGAVTDGFVNFALVLPGIFLLTYFTSFGPVALYGIIKLTDFVKMTIAALWLKRDLWVKNLAVQSEGET